TGCKRTRRSNGSGLTPRRVSDCLCPDEGLAPPRHSRRDPRCRPHRDRVRVLDRARRLRPVLLPRPPGGGPSPPREAPSPGLPRRARAARLRVVPDRQEDRLLVVVAASLISYSQAVILGLLQGVSELFPISSLGQSVVLPQLLGWNIHQNDPYFITFLVATHL